MAQQVKNLPAMQETRETWDATPWAVQSMEFSRPEDWSGEPFPSPGDLPNPGTEPRSPTLKADSFPAEPPGKPKNTRVGNLSVLQRIFPTWESNWGFLHYRCILYQLSNRGSPSHELYTLQIMFKIVRLQYCHFE